MRIKPSGETNSPISMTNELLYAYAHFYLCLRSTLTYTRTRGLFWKFARAIVCLVRGPGVEGEKGKINISIAFVFTIAVHLCTHTYIYRTDPETARQRLGDRLASARVLGSSSLLGHTARPTLELPYRWILMRLQLGRVWKVVHTVREMFDENYVKFTRYNCCFVVWRKLPWLLCQNYIA